MGIQGMAYPRTALVEGTIGLQRIRVTVDMALDMRVSEVSKCLINQHLVLLLNVFCQTTRNWTATPLILESIDLQIKVLV